MKRDILNRILFGIGIVFVIYLFFSFAGLNFNISTWVVMQKNSDGMLFRSIVGLVVLGYSVYVINPKLFK